MNLVKSCPDNLPEVQKASQKLGCRYDQFGNNQYMCLPNVEKSSLVEFCHEDIMGIHLPGM